MPTMNYSKLAGRIKEKGFTQRMVAKEIGISQSQFSLKMRCRYPFSQVDIKKLCELLAIPMQEIGLYFFTPSVEKSQQK